jgi:hypothetical protein
VSGHHDHEYGSWSNLRHSTTIPTPEAPMAERGKLLGELSVAKTRAEALHIAMDDVHPGWADVVIEALGHVRTIGPWSSPERIMDWREHALTTSREFLAR